MKPILSFKDMGLWEEKNLAPYAMKSKDSRGRKHKEKTHDYRGLYQRDRERIIHSTAFRRLEYKTQVFVNHEGDYYRTRLTHTLEVAQISRTIARTLGLNEDLTESIALAHDLGHTPFGHSGEEALNELMKGHGGFNHNVQGLRVVDYLEQKYPEFDGLNLSWEVREGIVKHSTSYDKPCLPAGRAFEITELKPQLSPTLETQVVDMADEIAYDNHDLDDGITSGLLHEEDVLKVKLWKRIHDDICGRYKNLNKEMKKYQIIRGLINVQVTDLINETQKRLKKFDIKKVEDVRKMHRRIVSFSPKILKEREPLKKFIFDYLYQHYRVIRMADKAKRFINELFNVYLSRPQQLPTAFRKRLAKEETHRVICDYIAGMTDRYAQDELKRLFEPFERV